MDCPPQPAIVYEWQYSSEKKSKSLKEQRLEAIVKEYSEKIDSDYLKELCKKGEPVIRKVLDDWQFYVSPKVLQTLKENQVLFESNHLSHLDYAYQRWWLNRCNIPVLTLGRENVSAIKSFAKIWEKSGYVQIPRDLSKTKNQRSIIENLQALVYSDYNLFNYPGAGRKRSSVEGIEEFKEGIDGIIFNAAKKFKKDIQIVPSFIGYSKPIELPFLYPIVDFAKAHVPRWYPYIDAAAFGISFLAREKYPVEKAIFAIGEPFPMLDFRKAQDATAEARKRVIALYEKFAPLLQKKEGYSFDEFD